MNRAQFGAKQAVEVCVGVKRGDMVVVIKDKQNLKETSFIEEAVKKIGGQLKTFVLEEIGPRPLKSLPSEILTEIKKADAAFICVQYFQDELISVLLMIGGLVKKNKVKIAFMFDLSEELLRQGMAVDYQKIKEFSYKLYGRLKEAKKVQVKTDRGSDFLVELGYKWKVSDGFPEPGKWVNLPGGEVLTAPKNINGRIVIDGLIEEFNQPRFGLLNDYPISVDLKNGYAVRESIKCKNRDLKRFLEKNLFERDKNASRVGEFAFGTNIYLKKLIGNLTQDEKFPTVHIAFGDPHGPATGAPWKSEIHMDALILEPTAWVDGKIIMKEGKYTA